MNINDYIINFNGGDKATQSDITPLSSYCTGQDLNLIKDQHNKLVNALTNAGGIVYISGNNINFLSPTQTINNAVLLYENNTISWKQLETIKSESNE